MKILSLDFESTWQTPVDPKHLRIREVGAVLFDWPSQRPLRIYSELIYEPDQPPSPKELVDLTGITDEMAKEYGISLGDSLAELFKLISKCDYVLAHNGNIFDKILLECEAARLNLMVPVKPWLDTKTDVLYPANIKSRKLVHLCAEMGFVNPFAHRAVFDCLSTLEVLKRFDINEVIALSKEKTVRIIAEVSYKDKDQAKGLGYYWNGEEKYWFKEVKERFVESEKAQATFNVYTQEV